MPRMSDNPSAFPPPPPPGVPPPAAPAGFPPPPVYQGPPAPDYVQSYLQQQAPAGQPPYVAQQPFPTAGAVAGGTGALLYQLGGPAAWSIGFGLVSIIVPFATNYYFPILPIAGGISAIRAIQRGRLIGGVIGIVVNVIGGLVSLLASGLIGG
jgi:hypothetical protein